VSIVVAVWYCAVEAEQSGESVAVETDHFGTAAVASDLPERTQRKTTAIATRTEVVFSRVCDMMWTFVVVWFQCLLRAYELTSSSGRVYSSWSVYSWWTDWTLTVLVLLYRQSSFDAACVTSNMTSVDTIMQYREDWSSASVVNHTIIADPTIRQPGFDLPHHTWSLMNRFRTGQGPCHANLHKRGLTHHLLVIVASDWPWTTWTKFEGGLNLLHEVDDDTVIWLECTVTAAVAE